MKTAKQVEQAVKDLSFIGKVIYYLQIYLLAPERCVDPQCPGTMKAWSSRKSYCTTCDTVSN